MSGPASRGAGLGRRPDEGSRTRESDAAGDDPQGLDRGLQVDKRGDRLFRYPIGTQYNQCRSSLCMFFDSISSQERVSDVKRLDERYIFGLLQTEASYSDSNPAPRARRHDLTWKTADFAPNGVPLTQEGAAKVRQTAFHCISSGYALSYLVRRNSVWEFCPMIPRMQSS